MVHQRFRTTGDNQVLLSCRGYGGVTSALTHSAQLWAFILANLANLSEITKCNRLAMTAVLEVTQHGHVNFLFK